MATKVRTKNEITIKGSTEIVKEFFGYAINSILYQRGIYPPEMFKRMNKYGLTMLVTTDEKVNNYLIEILAQLSDWLENGQVSKLVLVITGMETKSVLERWAFNIITELPDEHNGTLPQKEEKEIMNEIQSIIRQITASVTFLPLLNEPCTFDMLVYTKQSTSVPTKWEESDPKYIKNSCEVRLRSFSSKIHSVDAMVSYKNNELENEL